MNTVYKIQDLVIQKELTSYEKFKRHFLELNFNKTQKNYKYLCDNLKGIYTFCKILQHNPNSVLLAQSLRPMFKMLIDNIIISEKICVQDEKYGIIYSNITFKNFHELPLFQGRKIIQKEKDLFIIPHTKYPLISDKKHLDKLNIQRQLRHNRIQKEPLLRKMYKDKLVLSCKTVKLLTDFLL